jgi:hypothetical protein
MGIRSIRRVLPGRRWGLAVLTVLAVTLSTMAWAGGAQSAPPPSPRLAAVPSFTVLFDIINFNSNKCLQPAGTLPTALIVQVSCSSTSSLQQWSVSDLGDGTGLLRNLGSGLCMDLQVDNDGQVGIPTLVSQRDCSAGRNTAHWEFTHGSRQHFDQVFNLVQGLCMDVQNRSSADNALLQVIECKFLETAQEFQFRSH